MVPRVCQTIQTLLSSPLRNGNKHPRQVGSHQAPIVACHWRNLFHQDTGGKFLMNNPIRLLHLIDSSLTKFISQLSTERWKRQRTLFYQTSIVLLIILIIYPRHGIHHPTDVIKAARKTVLCAASYARAWHPAWLTRVVVPIKKNLHLAKMTAQHTLFPVKIRASVQLVMCQCGSLLLMVWKSNGVRDARTFGHGQHLVRRDLPADSWPVPGADVQRWNHALRRLTTTRGGETRPGFFRLRRPGRDR